MYPAIFAGFVIALSSVSAFALCPIQSATVTIPLSGEAIVVPYDQACNSPPAVNFVVWSDTSNVATPLTASTKPAVTADASGLHFTANGAAPGASKTVKISYTPNGLISNLTYVVGASVTAISFGTITP